MTRGTDSLWNRIKDAIQRYRRYRSADSRHVTVGETAVATGEVLIRVYDVNEMPDDWLQRSREYRAAAYLGEQVPCEREVVENTTTIELDEHRAQSLTASGSVDPVSGWEVGTGTAAPAYNDRDLTASVYTADVVSATSDGVNLNVSAFLDTTEANGNDLAEGGLRSQSGRLYNHATYTAITKTSNREIVYDVTLTFQTAP